MTSTIKTRTIEQQYMALALKEAEKAARQNEVPVGAVVVCAGQVVGKGHNLVEHRQDASQHAEIIALRKAARRIGTWRLSQCDLYVTLEPCAMCAGAIVWFRIQKLIYGAKDPKAGACGSVARVIPNKRLNHQPKVLTGILAAESAYLLQTFFKTLRQQKKAQVL